MTQLEKNLKIDMLYVNKKLQGGYIKERVLDNSSDILQEDTWKGAEISNIDEAIMSSTASNGLKGIYFKNVPINSAAYELGFRTNDVLKQVNDIELEDIAHLKLNVYKLSEKNSMILKIHRLGRMYEVEIQNR